VTEWGRGEAWRRQVMRGMEKLKESRRWMWMAWPIKTKNNWKKPPELMTIDESPNLKDFQASRMHKCACPILFMPIKKCQPQLVFVERQKRRGAGRRSISAAKKEERI
jgi:hypothetical protein